MMRRRKPRRWRLILPLILAGALVWLAGLFVFVEKIPRAPASAETTDVVVVLTGGPGRIQRGTKLLQSDMAKQLLISGVGSDVPIRDLISEKNLRLELIACCVTLGRAARDTRENAIETAGWAASRSIASIRLVTSDFHMPRSLLEFTRRLPLTRIIADPVPSKNVRPDQWWRRSSTAWLLAGEYTKYLATRLQMAFLQLTARA